MSMTDADIEAMSLAEVYGQGSTCCWGLGSRRLRKAVTG